MLASEQARIRKALQEMQNNQVEALPVVENGTSEKLMGVLDLRAARRSVGSELVRRKTQPQL